ncbi:hypothetical protein [Pontibacter cellulosilyticus]|uniref:OmpH family outer membrane protein n=1 Tax=Pontibacter cellulosilyticus TaxID=1720253 RepID=A0A923SIA3_9BACT|nr:hypothetical protein [Pontibacter cellulosilyticus]MBC5991451.1 hypothetical protein [Pontibacter cellulosilyticus]
MKRILLLAFAIGMCTTASAQLIKINEDAYLDKKVLEVKVEGADMIAMDLQNELNLSKEQYEQVVQLNQMRFKQIEEAEKTHQQDELLRSKTIYAINLETDKALGALLDPKQMRLYLEMESKQTRFVSDNAKD